MNETGRFERFLNFVGLWFTAGVMVWAWRTLQGVVDGTMTGQQFAALSTLMVLGILIALAMFLAGFRNLYHALKE